jgi:protein ImuB
VQVPVLSGGRGPAERITFTPLGDEAVPRADPEQPWPGQLPEPSPTVLFDDPVELFDADGNPVRVTGRGLFSAAPAHMAAPGCTDPRVTALLPAGADPGGLSWWAGPWPVDERWWDSGQAPTQARTGRTARVQVLLDGDGDDAGRAMLLCYRQRRWYLEGMYE